MPQSALYGSGKDQCTRNQVDKRHSIYHNFVCIFEGYRYRTGGTTLPAYAECRMAPTNPGAPRLAHKGCAQRRGRCSPDQRRNAGTLASWLASTEMRRARRNVQRYILPEMSPGFGIERSDPGADRRVSRSVGTDRSSNVLPRRASSYPQTPVLVTGRVSG